MDLRIFVIAPNSGKFVLVPFISSLLILIIPIQGWLLFVKYAIFLFFLGSALYMAWFFRDPKRIIVTDNNHILAAADGIIIYIREENDVLDIATRMSPFNVHINRSPINGRLLSVQHSPGTHRTVYFAGAEEKNERNLLQIDNDEIKCEIMQLTGAFARRLEVWKEIDDTIEQGEKFGMIRFGSQTNIRIKLEDNKKSLLPLVKIGDKVEAGLTVVAEIREI